MIAIAAIGIRIVNKYSITQFLLPIRQAYTMDLLFLFLVAIDNQYNPYSYDDHAHETTNGQPIYFGSYKDSGRAVRATNYPNRSGLGLTSA